MRILLFDWYSGGHHAAYLSAFTRALRDRHEVVVAAAPPEAGAAEAAGATSYPIARPFPLADTSRRLSRARREALRDEIALVDEYVHRSRADHVVHMFADGVLRGLVGRDVGAPVTALLFRPRWDFHRRSRDTLTALAYEATVAAWRHRRHANAMLTLDPVAAQRWRGLGGAPAYHLPEPPLVATAPLGGKREGLILFGRLAERKGIDYVARALEIHGRGARLVLAGSVAPGYQEELEAVVSRMRDAGVEVSLRARAHDEGEALSVLHSGCAALLPYVGHIGMSRVLLEAAVAGTPVIAHDEGLIGHLVRTRGLGLVVDCRDPGALSNAIREIGEDCGAADRYAPALARFADEHSSARFAAVLDAVFRPD
jgi:glycosyltransferase involved in cell wall biosynthesis